MQSSFLIADMVAPGANANINSYNEILYERITPRERFNPDADNPYSGRAGEPEKDFRQVLENRQNRENPNIDEKTQISEDKSAYQADDTEPKKVSSQGDNGRVDSEKGSPAGEKTNKDDMPKKAGSRTENVENAAAESVNISPERVRRAYLSQKAASEKATGKVELAINSREKTGQNLQKTAQNTAKTDLKMGLNVQNKAENRVSTTTKVAPENTKVLTGAQVKTPENSPAAQIKQAKAQAAEAKSEKAVATGEVKANEKNIKVDPDMLKAAAVAAKAQNQTPPRQHPAEGAARTADMRVEKGVQVGSENQARSVRPLTEQAVKAQDAAQKTDTKQNTKTDTFQARLSQTFEAAVREKNNTASAEKLSDLASAVSAKASPQGAEAGTPVRAVQGSAPVQSAAGISPAAASGPAEQISRAVAGVDSLTERQITIRLNPAELGALRISFKQTDEGLMGLIEVEKAKTRYDIEKSLPELTASLQSQGVMVRRIMVQQPQQSGQQENKNFADDQLGRELAREFMNDSGSDSRQKGRQETFDRGGDFAGSSFTGEGMKTAVQETADQTGLNFYL